MLNSRPKLAPSSPSAAAASAPPGAALRTDSVLPLEHGRTAARVRSANLNTGGRTLGRTRTWVRRAHGLVGVISALNLLLLIIDRKSTRLNSSHLVISYAVFCLKKKKIRR